MKSSVITPSKDTVVIQLEKLNFDIISIAYLSEDKKRKSQRMILHSFKLLVMLEGTACVFLGKNQYYVKKGDCILFAPGVLYHAQITGNEKCQFAAFNFDLETPLQSKIFTELVGISDIIISQSVIPSFTNQYIISTVSALLEHQPASFYNALLLLKRLVSIIAYERIGQSSILKVNGGGLSAEEMILKCHKHIINNPSQKITVKDLCGLCSVSQSYLYKCFSTVLGQSTKDFITVTKLKMSERELLMTDKRINDIALSFGFASGYQYSAVFKKVHGVSPLKYRQSNQ